MRRYSYGGKNIKKSENVSPPFWLSPKITHNRQKPHFGTFGWFWLQPKQWGYIFWFFDIFFSMDISPHMHQQARVWNLQISNLNLAHKSPKIPPLIPLSQSIGVQEYFNFFSGLGGPTKGMMTIWGSFCDFGCHRASHIQATNQSTNHVKIFQKFS